MSLESKKLWFALITLALSVALMLLLAEGVLRLSGQKPWRRFFTTQPVIYVPDDALGWRHRPGAFSFRIDRRRRPARIRFLDDGSRDTGWRDGPAPEVVLVGGSYVEGFAISDRETLAWRLQQRLPFVRFRNFGTGGYGTHQSRLKMEELFERGKRPVLVIYGLLSGHEDRNVAASHWLEPLARSARREGRLAVPYVVLDGDERLRSGIAGYPAWPLREQSAVVTSAQRLYARWIARHRVRAHEVTRRILVEMHETAFTHGSHLLVVMLDESLAASYAAFLGEHGVDFLDCGRRLTPELQVPGDGHPNAEMNRYWAGCVGPPLAERLSALLPGS